MFVVCGPLLFLFSITLDTVSTSTNGTANMTYFLQASQFIPVVECYRVHLVNLFILSLSLFS